MGIWTIVCDGSEHLTNLTNWIYIAIFVSNLRWKMIIEQDEVHHLHHIHWYHSKAVNRIWGFLISVIIENLNEFLRVVKLRVHKISCEIFFKETCYKHPIILVTVKNINIFSNIHFNLVHCSRKQWDFWASIRILLMGLSCLDLLNKFYLKWWLYKRPLYLILFLRSCEIFLFMWIWHGQHKLELYVSLN